MNANALDKASDRNESASGGAALGAAETTGFFAAWALCLANPRRASGSLAKSRGKGRPAKTQRDQPQAPVRSR